MRDEERKALMTTISNIRIDKLAVERERDEARIDKTKLAAWLKKNHPAVFREYFMSDQSGGA